MAGLAFHLLMGPIQGKSGLTVMVKMQLLPTIFRMAVCAIGSGINPGKLPAVHVLMASGTSLLQSGEANRSIGSI